MRWKFNGAHAGVECGDYGERRVGDLTKKLGKTSGNSEAVPIPAAGRGRKQKSVACGFFLAAGHVEVH